MAIQLDHAIVPSHNRVAAAQSLAGLLGVPWQESQGSFSPVYVNEELTLDFADRDRFEGHHVCFRVDDATFAALMRSYFEREIRESEQITPELHRQRSNLWRRIKWTISYWLVTSMDYTVTRRLNFNER